MGRTRIGKEVAVFRLKMWGIAEYSNACVTAEGCGIPWDGKVIPPQVRCGPEGG